MLKVINLIIKIVDYISSFIGKCVSWLILVMVFTTFGITFFRYVFNTGLIWIQELIVYMHVCVFMLMMSYTFIENKHVRIDIFFNRLSEKNKNYINLFGHIFFLIPMCLVIVIYGWNFVHNSWSILESSQEAGGLPFLYLLKSLIIIAPSLLMLQAIAEILKSIKKALC